MSTPDSSGDILRAIAKSYRDEVGPARAEQLADRAMARAGVRPTRLKTTGVLAPSLALAASLLAVGLIVLVGNSDPIASDTDPVTPVASSPVSQVSTPVAETTAIPILPIEELEEALNLIEQQKEKEAADVVVEALAFFALSIADTQSLDVGSSPTPTTGPEQQQTPPETTSGAGGVPPEQSTHPGEDPPSETDTSVDDPASGELDPQPPTSDPQPTIEELGQVLRVEVEELLAADPEGLAAAAEEAREVATHIQEHGEEPTILLPPDDDGDEK